MPVVLEFLEYADYTFYATFNPEKRDESIPKSSVIENEYLLSSKSPSELLQMVAAIESSGKPLPAKCAYACDFGDDNDDTLWFYLEVEGFEVCFGEAFDTFTSKYKMDFTYGREDMFDWFSWNYWLQDQYKSLAAQIEKCQQLQRRLVDLAHRENKKK